MMDQDKGSLNIGIRLVRNAVYGSGNVAGQIQQGGNEESGSHIQMIIILFWMKRSGIKMNRRDRNFPPMLRTWKTMM